MDNEVNNLADILEGKTPPPAPAPIQTPSDTPAPVAPPVTPPAPPAPKANEPAPGDQAKPIAPITNDNIPPAQPPFNFDAELEKISGGAIKSKDGIAALIEAGKRAADFESKLKTFEEENTSLKAKVATNPFANDYVKRLNELHQSGASDSQIQAFVAINKVKDLDGLDPIDSRLLALQIKNGLSEDEAKTYLKSTYKIDPEAYDEETVKSESIRLKVDANSDREFLKTHRAEVSKLPENPAEQQQREYEQQQADHVAKLSPIAKNVINDSVNFFKGFSINGKDGDQNIAVDFEATPESIKVMEEKVNSFIQNNWQQLPANEEGTKQIKQYAENLLAIQNYKTWIVNAASERELQVRAEYANPTPIKRGPDAPNPGKSSKEELDKMILDTYN